MIWSTIQQEASDWQRRKNAGASGSNDGQVFATMPERVFPAVGETFRTNVQGKIALDLGSGHGTTTIHLLEKGWKVIAVDFNDRALSFLQEKANKANKSWLETGQLVTTRANIEDYTLPEKVDLIVINDVLPYCNPNKIKGLWDKIYASLADNGHIAGTFFEAGGQAHMIWTMYGAWFVKDIKFVEKLLSESNYKKELCRYRPKAGGSSVIEFIGLKNPNSPAP